MSHFTPLDLAVLLLYLAGVTAWGAWLGRGQESGTDYFLGNRELPWGAVMLSVVATETSTLTFLSIPGVAYLGTFTFLQLTFGYLAGRIVVSLLLVEVLVVATVVFILWALQASEETQALIEWEKKAGER